MKKQRVEGSNPRIRSIHLNRWERPLRATVWTEYGSVKVAWKDVAEGRDFWPWSVAELPEIPAIGSPQKTGVFSVRPQVV